MPMFPAGACQYAARHYLFQLEGESSSSSKSRRAIEAASRHRLTRWANLRSESRLDNIWLNCRGRGVM